MYNMITKIINPRIRGENEMNEKTTKKISLSKFFLILALIVIIVMVFFMYKIYNDKNIEIKKATELQSRINDLNKTMNEYQEKINSISETTNSNNNQANLSNETSTSNTTNNVKYEISIRDEIYATIKAKKDGKTITKEFEMDAAIAETGTMTLPTIGNVALVADSGGEYYGVNVYQLVNGNIEKIGTINCGADMITDATYNATIKNETTVDIVAKRNNENIEKEFKIDAAIVNTYVIDILNCGKVVLVAESGGEYYAFKVFRLSQDYTTGKTVGIIEVGTLTYLN